MASESSKTTRRGAGAVGVAVALAIHGGVATALVKVSPSWLAVRAAAPVEVQLVEPPPPLPAEPEQVKPPPEPPPPPPRPRLAMRRAPAKPPAEPPPPPNQEPPPEPPAEPPPVVFGATVESTITGESNVAVPVGNTLTTNDRTPAKATPQPYAAEGPPGFAPVAEAYVGEYPNPKQRLEAPYPVEARRLGLEGKVVLKIGIDRGGVVRAVRVVKRAGHGFDEAAANIMWKYRFTPARAKTGQPVDFQITYTYTFRMDR
jgi:protein TonB